MHLTDINIRQIVKASSLAYSKSRGRRHSFLQPPRDNTSTNSFSADALLLVRNFAPH